MTPLFLALPGLLYKGDNPRSRKTEKLILTETHPLSGGMTVYPFVVAKDKKVPLCRAILTVYDSEKTGYVGFFEAENNPEAVRLLFDTIRKSAKMLGLQELLGPIDCSIYLGYRFKEDRFDEYFTGEPYNKPYYAALWEQMGFSKCNQYASYQIAKVTPEDSDERLERVLQRFLRRGYVFSSLSKKDFEKCLIQVYELMDRTYAGFVGFKSIGREQFCAMFSSLKNLVDFDMVKLVHKDGKLHAFCICIPNYGKLGLGKMSLLKFLRFLAIRKKADEYVIMYLGADETCCGLGSALVHFLEKSFCIKQCTAIAALIKEGGVSAKYYAKHHQKQYRYSLYSYPLSMDEVVLSQD